MVGCLRLAAGLWGGVVATCHVCVFDRPLPLERLVCTLTARVSALLLDVGVLLLASHSNHYLVSLICDFSGIFIRLLKIESRTISL